MPRGSTLARQIEQGAPVDVYISANPEWVDYLGERALVREGTRADLLGNGLVLVAPAASALALEVAPDFDLVGALGGGRLAMGDPDHVPAGIYGKAALERLGVWHAVAPQVARADNVRAALALVARDEARSASCTAPTRSPIRASSGRHLPRGQPSADHLPGRGDRRQRAPGGGRARRVPALGGRSASVRALRLHLLESSLLDFPSPDELAALRLSLRVGLWNLLIDLPLAVAVALLLARRRFPGKELLNGLVHLSLILPPVVTGYLLLLLFGRRGPFGALLEDWFGARAAAAIGDQHSERAARPHRPPPASPAAPPTNCSSRPDARCSR